MLNVKKLGGPLFFVLVLTGTLLWIFWEPLFSGLFIWGPDAGSGSMVNYRRALPWGLAGRWSDVGGLGVAAGFVPIVPFYLLLFLFPWQIQLPVNYIAAVLATVLAAGYLFKGRGLHGWPAWIGAFALGLSSHTFSLIAAGHWGKLHSIPFLVLFLASVDRAVERRSLFHYAAAGLCLGVGFVSQADLAYLYLLLGAAYGAFLCIRTRQFVKPLAGAAIALVLFIAVAGGSYLTSVKGVVSSRAELAQSTGSAQSGDQGVWEFATNWSLPPEELLEFVAPCLFGIQTGDARAPYWGRLGRTQGWEVHHQGLMNLRQHTVYLGVLQLAMACFALFMAVRLRLKKGVRSQMSADTRQGAAGDEAGKLPSTIESAQVFFWSGALIVSILFALGRYFPQFYRLFYVLPAAASLRAPVKFLHLAEVSLAVLFAYGLASFFGLQSRAKDSAVLVSVADGNKNAGKKKQGARAMPDAAVSMPDGLRVWKGFAIALFGISVLFLFGLLMASGRQVQFAETWGNLGLGNYTGALAGAMTGALVHSVILFAVTGALFVAAIAGRSRSWARTLLPMVTLLVLALEMVSVDGKYVTVWDEFARYKPRAILEQLPRGVGEDRVAIPVRGGFYELWKRRFFRDELIVDVEDEDRTALPGHEQDVFKLMANNPLRYWQITSTRNVFLPTSYAERLGSSVDWVKAFNVDSEGQIVAMERGKGPHAWIRLTNSLPRAAVYSAEMVAGEEALLRRMADPGWDPMRSVLITNSVGVSGSEMPAVPAVIVSHGPNRVVIDLSTEKAGILMLTDRYDPGWRVTVDGVRETLLRCNGIMRGVAVRPGAHRVEFFYAAHAGSFAVSAAAVLVVLVWAIVGSLAKRRLRPQAVPDAARIGG